MPEFGWRIFIFKSLNIHNKCLNCNETVVDKFCSHCGQKTDTHRITFKHLIFHDIVHGVWHIEKGILFTLKSALSRPGKAATEYIAGKRIRYYNIFYLILIFIGLTIVLENKILILDTIYGIDLDYNPDEEFNAFIDYYSKLLITSLIPFFALFGFLLFKKSKYNFSEHFVIAGMIFLGIIVLNFLFSFLLLFKYTTTFDFIAEVADILLLAVLLLFIVFGYYNALGKSYTKIGFLWRIVTLLVLLVAIMFLLVILIMYVIL